MSGGKGGSGSKPIKVPGQVQLPLDGFGYDIPSNPDASAPDWAKGYFAMPWWSKPAPNVGMAMLKDNDPMRYAQLQQRYQVGSPLQQLFTAPSIVPRNPWLNINAKVSSGKTSMYDRYK